MHGGDGCGPLREPGHSWGRLLRSGLLIAVTLRCPCISAIDSRYSTAPTAEVLRILFIDPTVLAPCVQLNCTS